MSKEAEIGGAGARGRKVKVKTARKRSVSSVRWLQRQLNDPYVMEAKRLHYRSRAAFKIIELDERFNLFHPGARVVDLGAAPGGWSQIASARVNSTGVKGKVVAIDLLEISPVPGVEFLQMDFLDNHAPERLKVMLGGDGADLVMSDMAANSTGHRKTDYLKTMALCESALSFAQMTLAPGGTFLSKVLRGGTEHDLLIDMKRDFTSVRHVKPRASRSESAEIYVVATGFRNKTVPDPSPALSNAPRRC